MVTITCRCGYTDRADRFYKEENGTMIVRCPKCSRTFFLNGTHTKDVGDAENVAKRSISVNVSVYGNIVDYDQLARELAGSNDEPA